MKFELNYIIKLIRTRTKDYCVRQSLNMVLEYIILLIYHNLFFLYYIQLSIEVVVTNKVLLCFNYILKNAFFFIITCIFRCRIRIWNPFCWLAPSFWVRGMVGLSYSMNIFISIVFSQYCNIPIYNNFRVTEILVVLSGDFCRYLTFSFMSRQKLLNFIKWEIIILWRSLYEHYVYNMIYIYNM